jgi:Domain of unknown function (DUF6438)
MAMDTPPTPAQLPPGHQDHRIRLWHELLFSLNLAGVFSYWFLSYCQDLGLQQLSRYGYFGYYLRASSLRLDDFLHIASQDMQFARYAPRFMPTRAASLGAELLILFSTFALAYLFFVTLRIATTPAIEGFLKLLTGMTSIFALPAMYILLLKTGWEPSAVHGFWQDFRPAVLFGEILVFVLLIGVSLMHRPSLWMTLPLVLAHGALWLYFSWPHFYALPQQVALSPQFFILAFPLSAMVWLLFWKTAQTDQPRHPEHGLQSFRLALGAPAAIIFLLLAWWPSRSYPIGKNGRLDSLVIELHRSSCFGSCRPYDLTIRGNGDVRFIGWHRYPNTEYTNHATLTPEQVSRIVLALDRSRFFALDDRAFDWCFDTPIVNISVSVNGKSKWVGSDGETAHCAGPKLGRQVRFVVAAAEIDSIVGTKQWLEK